MNNIISWYNKNTRKFWVTIIAILVGALLLWRLMGISGQKQEERGNKEINKIDTSNFNAITMASQKSAISGENITTPKEGIAIIDNFISYCNSGKIQEAYNLLSNECKEEMFSNVKIFQERYYKPIFGGNQKNVTIENWINDTYKVDIREDMLSTGKYSENNTIQDYITIVSDSTAKNKLNINRYIGRKTFDKTSSTNNIDIKLIKEDIYMDYEFYTFQVKNDSNNAIALGDTQDKELSYLVDTNDMHYDVYLSELSQIQLIVNMKQTRDIKIKYFNQYSSTRKIKQLVFPRVILNYNAMEGIKNNLTQFKFEL